MYSASVCKRACSRYVYSVHRAREEEEEKEQDDEEEEKEEEEEKDTRNT